MTKNQNQNEKQTFSEAPAMAIIQPGADVFWASMIDWNIHNNMQQSLKHLCN